MAARTCHTFYPHGSLPIIAAALIAAGFSMAAWGQDIRQPQRGAVGQPLGTQGQATGQPRANVRQPGSLGQQGQAQQQPGQPATGQPSANTFIPASPRQPAGVGPLPRAVGGAPQQQPIQVLQPAWFPLPQAQSQHVEKVLDYWQQRSAKVKTFQCKFRRWKYDPVFLRPAPTAN